MKHIIALIIASMFATFAVAQDRRPELTPEQKLKGALVLANAGTALLVGPIALPAAILSGQKEGLCKVLGGTYTPNSDGQDQCPGGVWLRIIPYLGKD
jgi:hypothetical protein